MPEVKQLAPWEIYHKEIKEMFGEDPEITIQYDQEEHEIKLLVCNAAKADALTALLPAEKTFGAITVKLTVIPENAETSMISLFQRAFDGNPVFSYAQHTEGSWEADYIVFANKVVQYHSDNLGDINKNTSTLYQDIAARIFDNHSGVFFCTDTEDLPFCLDCF